MYYLMMVIKSPYDNSNNNYWWDRDDSKLDYSVYTINQSQIFVGKRPDLYGMNENTYNQMNSFINVSDRFVKHRGDKLNSWHPWAEGGVPTEEFLFSVLKTLDYQINELKLKKIYIHCDLGTHRAPSIFGLYLLAYHTEEAHFINNTHKEVGRTHWSDPLSYAWSYVKNEKTSYLKFFIGEIKNTKSTNWSGVSMSESFLNSPHFKEHLVDFQKRRLYQNSTKTIWKFIKNDLIFLFSYQMKRPFIKVYRSFHKFFNTKTGQELKKYKL